MGTLLQLPQTARRAQWKDTLRGSQRKAIINKLDVLRATAPCRLIENGSLARAWLVHPLDTEVEVAKVLKTQQDAIGKMIVKNFDQP